MTVNPYRVLVAGDHAVVRHGLRVLLQAGFQVCGEASTGLEAIDCVKKGNPDLLVLDLTMPDMNGLEVMRAIHGESPFDRCPGSHHALLRRAGTGNAALRRARLRAEVRRRHRATRRCRPRSSPPAIFYQPAGDFDGAELRSQAGRHYGVGRRWLAAQFPAYAPRN